MVGVLGVVGMVVRWWWLAGVWLVGGGGGGGWLVGVVGVGGCGAVRRGSSVAVPACTPHARAWPVQRRRRLCLHRLHHRVCACVFECMPVFV